jgi:serine phosphatase RsbU (regulator of sigma subunit)
VLSSLYRHRRLPPEEMVHALLAGVQPFGSREQHDDITLIVAQCAEL